MLLWFLSLFPPPLPLVHYCLPSLAVCETRCVEAKEHLEYVRFQLWADKGTPAERHWDRLAEDAEWRILVWQAATAYRQNEGCPEHRETLRWLLGDDAYFNGRVPSSRPGWRVVDEPVKARIPFCPRP